MSDRTHDILAITEDVGAAGLSAIPIVGGVLTGFVQARSNHETRVVIRVLTSTLEALSSRVDSNAERIAKLEDALETEELNSVVQHAVNRSDSFHEASQFHLMGEIVASAIISVPTDPVLDRAHLLIDLVGRLQPDHLKVLRKIANPTPKNGPPMVVGHDGVTSIALQKLLPELKEVTGPLVAWLAALGLVENTGASRGGGAGQTMEWRVTDFGLQLTDFLEESHH